MNKDLISVYKTAAPPFPTAIMAGCYNVSLKETMGVNDSFKTLYCLIESDQNEWYFSKSETKKIALKVIDVLSEDPSIVEKAKARFLKDAEKILK